MLNHLLMWEVPFESWITMLYNSLFHQKWTFFSFCKSIVVASFTYETKSGSVESIWVLGLFISVPCTSFLQNRFKVIRMDKALGHSVIPVLVTIGLQAQTGVRARCELAGHAAALPTEISGAVTLKDYITYPDGHRLKPQSLRTL